MGLFDFLKKKTSSKCVILGLDSSGKSTIISFIQTGTFVEHTPTMGKSRAEIEIEGTRLALFDMGGQEDFRAMWMGELNNAKVVIFVVDSANPGRFNEARVELMKLFPLIKERKIKLIVLANKRDIPKVIPIPDVIKALDLEQIENFEIFPVSAKTGYGLADAFAKIYSEISGKQIKKRIVAKAISVFDNGGVPLVTERNDFCDDDVLKGGLFAAICSFIRESFQKDIHEMKIGAETILIHRTEHFIGTLIWSENLQIPKDQSMDALKELLLHMEKLESWRNIEYAPIQAQQYLTNIL